MPNPRNTAATISSGHTLRLVPSELLLLQPKSAVPAPVFIGIADPIYNLADSRATQHFAPTSAEPGSQPIYLARLVESISEVKTGAKMSGISDVELLMGANASGGALRKLIAGKRPEILHFAVHVVSPRFCPEEAALALSLTRDGASELLTSEVISTYRVPGSLIIMSGCSSGQGLNVPGAGLIGLSRAWLLAGASAVIVSAWPTPDYTADFFTPFYTHLRSIPVGPLAQRASLALQQTQTELAKSVGHSSSPSFWAAYSVISDN